MAAGPPQHARKFHDNAQHRPHERRKRAAVSGMVRKRPAGGGHGARGKNEADLDYIYVPRRPAAKLRSSVGFFGFSFFPCFPCACEARRAHARTVARAGAGGGCTRHHHDLSGDGGHFRRRRRRRTVVGVLLKCVFFQEALLRFMFSSSFLSFIFYSLQ